jgi:hypothetical protein
VRRAANGRVHSHRVAHQDQPLRQIREGESPESAALVRESSVTSPRTVNNDVEKPREGDQSKAGRSTEQM